MYIFHLCVPWYSYKHCACMYVAPKIGFNYVMRFLTISAVPNFGPCNVPPLHGHTCMAPKSLTLVPETYYHGQCCYIVWRYAPSMSLHYKTPKSGFNSVIPGYMLHVSISRDTRYSTKRDMSEGQKCVFVLSQPTRMDHISRMALISRIQ